MGRVLVGTSSWTDPTLLRSGWYPAAVRSAEGRLRFYAQNFSLVEVDSFYYAVPPQDTARLWCERTAAGFTFDIKAFSLLTLHPTQTRMLPVSVLALLRNAPASIYYRDLPPDAVVQVWREFEAALLPLDSCGKLGTVLFQFPPWFLPGALARSHIVECQRRLPQYRLAIEFRHGSWMAGGTRAETLSFLRHHGLAYVCVDEPQGFASSVPAVPEVTGSVGVVRFHGRNGRTWERKDVSAAERFRYLYSREELAAWVPVVRQMAASSQEVHVLFNNCYADYGVKNARDLDTLLRITTTARGEEPAGESASPAATS